MSVSKRILEVETGLVETQNQRDARVEELWRKLDLDRSGELDWKGLKRGLRKIDHRKAHESGPPCVDHADAGLQL